MASPTPPQTDTPAPLARGIHVDEHQIEGHVVVSVVTHCEHKAETAIIHEAWYALDRGESIKRELQVSLDKRCAPWFGEERCTKCPFRPTLRAV